MTNKTNKTNKTDENKEAVDLLYDEDITNEEILEVEDDYKIILNSCVICGEEYMGGCFDYKHLGSRTNKVCLNCLLPLANNKYEDITTLSTLNLELILSTDEEWQQRVNKQILKTEADEDKLFG